MLRFVLHIIGDVQQPLHCTNYFSSEFPEGDKGGNLYNVTYNGSIYNWHYLWDSFFLEDPEL